MVKRQEVPALQYLNYQTPDISNRPIHTYTHTGLLIRYIPTNTQALQDIPFCDWLKLVLVRQSYVV